jgi:putative transposase
LNAKFKGKDTEMAHQSESNLVDTFVQLLCESGMSQMAEAVRIMLNEAMRLERSQVIEAQPYQCTESRRGYANGFKPKTLDTRLGAITFEIPQTRNVEFYPSALEKGVRSERALKLAIEEMYVQGVSTRKVTTVMQQLCGLEGTKILLGIKLVQRRQRSFSSLV